MLTHGEVCMWRRLDLLTHVLDIQTFWERCKFLLLLLSIGQIFFHILFPTVNIH